MRPQEHSDDPDPSQYLFVSLEQKRKDQSKPYDGKKMVWVPDEKECYILANVKEFKGDINVVDCGKGDEVSLSDNSQNQQLRTIQAMSR